MRAWLHRLFHRDREIHDEIEVHLQMREELNAEGGMSRETARLAARRQFGNAAFVEEEVRRVHALPWLGTVAQDLRYAWRGFGRSPVFTLTAVLIVALGIGSSTAVFSVVDRILFRPLPYPDADRLVSVGLLAPSADTNEFLMAPSYLGFRERQTPFVNLAAFAFSSECDLTEERPLRLRCALVDSAFLPTFGIRPLAGRNFTAQEDAPKSPKVALLSYGLWTSRFGGDPGIVGRTIPVDGQPTTIIGVLPREFELFNLSSTDLLMPAALQASQEGRAVRAFGRLRPGIPVEQARAAMQPLFEEARRQLAPQLRGGVSLAVRPLRDRQTWTVRTASWSLLGAVLLVLVMACGNVANLLLARSAARRREWAVRHALGAGRGRLLRQAITESLLLAGCAAVAGCGLAWTLLRFFVAVAPRGIARLDQATLDGRVLLFAISIAAAGGILFGLAPALERPDLEALSGGRSIVSFRGWLRHALITVQIAASLVLLTGAGLLLRTLWSLERVPLGMNPDQVITARIALGRSYSTARLLAFYEGLEARWRELPSKSAAAIGSTIPPYGGTGATPYSALTVEGRPPLPDGVGGVVAWRLVSPGYFAALGIPIRRGRAFDEGDRANGAAALVLSESLARRLFGADDPLGRRMFPTAHGQWHTVVGVAADVLNNGLRRPPGSEYYEVSKHTAPGTFGNTASLVLRSPLSPTAAANLIRAEIAALEPSLPVEIQSMRERVAVQTAEPQFNAFLLSGFAVAGLMLAAIGLYGVIAFLATQRSREIGVRMALGATPSNISRLFLLHAARWTGAGLCLGLAGALAASRLVGTLLFAVPARDVWSILGAAAILCGTALAAAWLPSRRASRIDPLRALREE